VSWTAFARLDVSVGVAPCEPILKFSNTKILDEITSDDAAF